MKKYITITLISFTAIGALLFSGCTDEPVVVNNYYITNSDGSVSQVNSVPEGYVEVSSIPEISSTNEVSSVVSVSNEFGVDENLKLNTTYYVTGINNYLALRTAPYYDGSNEIGKLNNGDTVEVLSQTIYGDKGEYCYVTSTSGNANGKSGYVNRNYISLKNEKSVLSAASSKTDKKAISSLTEKSESSSNEQTSQNSESLTEKYNYNNTAYAADLVNKSLYEVIDTLGNDYALDNHGNVVYENCDLTLVTDFQRNISTPNELAEPLPESEKQRFNEALKNKTLTLRWITITGDGKLDNNINANMHYNDLTPYYGDFNCEIRTLVEIPYTGHSSVYLYNVTDAHNDYNKINDNEDYSLISYVFELDDKTHTETEESYEKLKVTNPRLYKINVYPGCKDEGECVDWTTGHGYTYVYEKKGTYITLRHQYGGNSYLELRAADGALISCFVLDWNGDSVECTASDKKGGGKAGIKLTVNDDRSKIELELEALDDNLDNKISSFFDTPAQSKLSCDMTRDNAPYIKFIDD